MQKINHHNLWSESVLDLPTDHLATQSLLQCSLSPRESQRLSRISLLLTEDTSVTLTTLQLNITVQTRSGFI